MHEGMGVEIYNFLSKKGNLKRDVLGAKPN
jgi:hypothetical protein